VTLLIVQKCLTTVSEILILIVMLVHRGIKYLQYIYFRSDRFAKVQITGLRSCSVFRLYCRWTQLLFECDRL